MKENIVNDNGLLVNKESNQCVGYLFCFNGQAFSPDGLVGKLSDEDIKRHNETLSQAEILGLDNNCKVGQGGLFYFSENKGVHTWIGAVVSTDVKKNGNKLTFKRDGKVFEGELSDEGSCFEFKRVK